MWPAACSSADPSSARAVCLAAAGGTLPSAGAAPAETPTAPGHSPHRYQYQSEATPTRMNDTEHLAAAAHTHSEGLSEAGLLACLLQPALGGCLAAAALLRLRWGSHRWKSSGLGAVTGTACSHTDTLRSAELSSGCELMSY